MAENDNQLYLTLCKLQELFKGRYSIEEVATILGHNDGHLDRSVQFILEKEPQEIRRLLETEKNSWTTIETKTRRIKKEHRYGLVRPSIVDRAKSGCIDTSARQFACEPCDSSWWRRTPARKQVSRCDKCRVRYNPVPRDREWGWAEFKCPHPGCGREFGGWCAMNMTSPCFGCRRPIAPSRILPPNKRQDGRGRRNAHSCDAPDCVGRMRAGGGYYAGGNTTCVHPSSRVARGLPRVITPSEPHDSTGSTVETFLSQGELTKVEEVFYPRLATVREEDGGDTDSLGGNPGSDDGDEGEGPAVHPPGPVGQERRPGGAAGAAGAPVVPPAQS